MASHRGLLLSLLSLLASLFGCSLPDSDMRPPRTVATVDLNRYAGTWYEIARFPHRFQKNCYASRAIYALRDDGLIQVTNECRQGAVDGPLKSVQGKARVVDRESNAKLQVSFFWPFWGDYWIIDLDPDYQWAVVGHPSRRYLWILGRNPNLEDDVLRGIRQRLQEQRYDLAALILSSGP